MIFITLVKIVGEHMECHLGGNLGQTLHQEVCRAHPHLQCAKGMLGRFATSWRIACEFLSRRFYTAYGRPQDSQEPRRR